MSLALRIIFALVLPVPAFAVETCPYTVQDSFNYLNQKYSDHLYSKNADELAQKDEIWFNNSGFGDEDVPYLCSLTQLKILKIFNDGAEGLNKLSGKDLSGINFLTNLVTLDLDGNNIPATALAQLPNLKKLKYFQLGQGNPASSEGIAEAVKNWTSLLSFSIANNNLTGADIQWIQQLERPIYLGLGFNPAITNKDLIVFKDAKVSGLSVRGTGINSSENFEVLAANENLASLDISALNLSAEELVKVLNKLALSKSLQDLTYASLVKPPEVYQALLKISWLKEVVVTDTDIATEPVTEEKLVKGLAPFMQDSVTQKISISLSDFMMATPMFIKPFCAAVVAAYPKKTLYVNMGSNSFDCAQLPF